LPVFLSNKAISVTALVVTGSSMVTNGSRRTALGAVGFLIARRTGWRLP
jgi:hypothetical protein